MWRVADDFRYAVRSLVVHPRFLAAAVIPLALGIGATSAIFSVVYAVLLRPLPFDHPETIVRVWEIRPRMGVGHRPGAGGFTLDHFREWRDHNTVFESMAAYDASRFSVTGGAEPERMSGARVSPDLFPLLRVSPLFGRGFSREEEQPGRGNVLVLSYRTWQNRYGGDPAVVGGSVRIDGVPYTIVGVMPEGFEFPDRSTRFWIPLTLKPPRPGVVEMLPVIARLKGNVRIQQAEAEARALIETLRQDSSENDPRHRGVEVHLGSLHEQMVAPVRPALYVLFAAVGFVLLIVCANVANLLLSRTVSRQRELAMRAALGAGRARLAQQLLIESLVLGLLGGTLGLVVAYGGLRLLSWLRPENVPRLDEVTLNGPVLAFTLAVALLTAILFGSVPALKGGRMELLQSLKEGSEAVGLGLFRGRRRGEWLPIVEIVLAVVLLVGAGLLLRSFVRLVQIAPGYEPRNVLTVSLHLPPSAYGSAETRRGFYTELLARSRALGGVQAAGIVNVLPLTRARFVIGLRIEGRPMPTRLEDMPRAELRLVSPGYFQAMGIPLLRGRVFTGRDRRGAPPVVVINRRLAGELWGDEDPLGQHLQLGEIVGVVGDVRSFGLDAEPTGEVYLSYLQVNERMAEPMSQMHLVLRTRPGVRPLSRVAPLATLVRSLDPELPIDNAQTLEQRLSDSVARPRFYAVVLGVFAVVALILAATGVYAVVSYSVSRRTAETGIRMAVGAEASDIVRMVLGEGMWLAGVGVAGGLLCSLASSRVLSGMLFGVGMWDGATLAGVCLLMVLVALLACYLPARRAARIDPAEALRYE